MKFWIRVLVAVAVILVAVFAVWAFFFREKDEVQAYNKTAELIDYKESIGFKEKLIDLRLMNYYHNDKSLLIGNTSSSEQTIQKHREVLLSLDYIDVGTDLEMPSYFVADVYLDNIIADLLPYTISNKSQSGALKQVKNSIEDYLNKLKAANTVLTELVDFQKQIEGTSVEVDVLAKFYDNFSNKYRESLSAGGQVAISIMNYIDKCVFGDGMLLDVNFALSDAYARALVASKNCDKNQESRYASDLLKIMNVIDSVAVGNDIYTEKTQYEFLQAYTKLFNDYAGELDDVYASVDSEKQKMAAGDEGSLSKILQDARGYISTILVVLGF